MKKVLFVLTSHDHITGHSDIATGFNFYELSIPFKLFVEAGLHCEISSIQGGRPFANPDTLDLEHDESRWFHNSSDYMCRMENSQPLANVDGTGFSGILFVGGAGALFDFPECSAIEKVARVIYDQGGVIGALGNGSSALVRMKDLIQGKCITAATNDEELELGMTPYLPCRKGGKTAEDILSNAGAIFRSGTRFQWFAQSDERIVTGQNAESSTIVAQEILRILNSN
jgi:putative intracellular protease/amidase